ncbi:putative alpha-galactosidase B [Psilocybe cubensis]|uniref:Alpha-galactosidase B n=1 Tax=Psilocybe cubensis TaxID=181762 RepID=A0ACB8GT67_PSICU|nr:putative alpha-galactosidase B [Psilocybe cubensis]KAH9478771.1 putative alpha-galactosidase B [Psilocybe cubensis]
MFSISFWAVTLGLVAFNVNNPVNAINNGVARLPSHVECLPGTRSLLNTNALGTDANNEPSAYSQCNIDENLLLTTAKLMKSLGLQAAGYNFVNIDDCYAEKNRTASGDIQEGKLCIEQPFSVMFCPTDFKVTIRQSSLQEWDGQAQSTDPCSWIYSDSGWFTCAGYPGSFMNEVRDATTFAKWGFDYLKYDNCAIPYDDIIKQGIVGKYQRMADALAQVSKTFNRPFVFSLCEWGWTTGDIAPQWNSLASIINFNSFITQATDFYGRNDLDMLQLGNGGLTFEESKSHFTAWALMKSPLLIGTNLSAITPDILEILTNREILAINQDPVEGTSISPFRWGINPDWTSNSTHPAQYWSGPSENGTVFMLLNTLDTPSTMFFNLTESPFIRAGRQYSVRDLWSHTNNGTAVRNFTATDVPPHGVVALLLKDAGDEPAGLFPACSVWWQCTDKNGTHVGG